MGGKKKSNAFLDFIQGQDQFTESIQFSFDNGETEFKTRIGGICSIILNSILLGYAIWQALVMFKFEEYTVTYKVDQRGYNQIEVFSGLEKQPLTFAFGLHSRLNEDYGTMKAFYE